MGSGQEWTLPAQLGQLKTGQDGKGLLQIHPWCPDDLPRLLDGIEESNRMLFETNAMCNITSQREREREEYK